MSHHCNWHQTGKPTWWTGRFFADGCVVCEEKAKADPSLRAEKTPEQCFEAYKRERQKAGQRAGVVARMRKARAAMAANYAAQLAPGRG